MKTIYEFGIRLPLGKLFNPVKELEESINSNLATLGVNEKLSVGYVHSGTVEVEREMTEIEIETMKNIMLGESIKSFGSAKMEYFRRKPGNVSQLVTQ